MIGEKPSKARGVASVSRVKNLVGKTVVDAMITNAKQVGLNTPSYYDKSIRSVILTEWDKQVKASGFGLIWNYDFKALDST